MIELSTEEKILEIILDNGINIGSMAWGGATEMSDVDYAISRTNFLKIVTLYDEVGPSTTLTLRWVSNYSDNLMFNIENIKLQYNEKIFKRVLNLIVYEDDDLNKINTLNFKSKNKSKGNRFRVSVLGGKKMSRLSCSSCGNELGLRERYERLLDLLEAGMIVFHSNNRFEQDQTNPQRAEEVMQASVQMYNILGTYWNDIPGETITEKIKNIDEKRIYERDENGSVTPIAKEDGKQIILQ